MSAREGRAITCPECGSGHYVHVMGCLPMVTLIRVSPVLADVRSLALFVECGCGYAGAWLPDETAVS